MGEISVEIEKNRIGENISTIIGPLAMDPYGRSVAVLALYPATSHSPVITFLLVFTLIQIAFELPDAGIT